MGVFSNIMDRIFHHGRAAAPQATATPRPAAPQPAPQAAFQQAPQASAPQPQPVDVEAVLVELAETRGGGGDWRGSIVDLLKLVDLDPSLEARKQLADELDVHAGPNGSAEENIALHHAVMQKLAENGGRVPASLRGG
jgi:hypothetical protein